MLVKAYQPRLRFFNMLKYQTVPVTAFEQNCSIVWCDETMKAAVIDPGGDLPRITAAVARLGVKLKAIWLTHAHLDHAGGTAELSRQLGLPIIGPHPGDQFWIDGLAEQSRRFGLPPTEAFTPTRWLQDGDTVSIGHCTLNGHCLATRRDTWSSTPPKPSAPSSATCCLPVRSAAPTSPRATTPT
jgi:glyoxylase-like metal-dependent hydrolase (beta-lactamase superfamily II)